MKVLPILFNTEMVRAILDGRKTVTRRVVKITVNGNEDAEQAICASAEYPARNYKGLCANFSDAHGHYCGAGYPPYRPDDILYVRESYIPKYYDIEIANYWNGGNRIVYKADWDALSQDVKDSCAKPIWKPSIHMPREAARIFLRVTDVRVERLQIVDFFDCINEGIPYKQYEVEIIKDFANVWDSTIKPAAREHYGWAANPWVWVIAFEQTEEPEEG